MEDWIEDLMEFDPEIVEGACREWRQTERRRPTPADIRLLAIAEQRRLHPALPAPEPREEAPSPPPTAEEIAHVDAIVAALTGKLKMPAEHKQDLGADKAAALDGLAEAIERR